MNPQVRSYVLQKYGYPEDLSDDALKNAMDQTKDAQLQTLLGRAGATIGAAMSGIKADNQFYDDMNQQARSKVTDLITRRKAQSDDLAFQNAQIYHQQMQATRDWESPQAKLIQNSIKSFPQFAEKLGDSINYIAPADMGYITDIMKLKEQTDARREASSLNLLDRKLNISDKLSKNKDIEKLPAEDQEVIKDLAKKNASKQSITNQINSVINILERSDVSEEQKLVQGRQLLKTLNSTEGSDAIGKEEAERLGSFLNFHVMNMTQPGPMFGRDIGAFTKQAKLTAGAVQNAIKSNEMNIAQRYQQSGVARVTPVSNVSDDKKKSALEWIKKNPNDPRAKLIIKRLGVDVQS